MSDIDLDNYHSCLETELGTLNIPAISSWASREAALSRSTNQIMAHVQ